MPLQQHNLGVARRRTRRVDGVKVDPSLPRDAVRALRSATRPTAPVRGRLGTARGPRGCPRRPRARRWRAGVDGRPPWRRAPRRPLSGAVLDVSPAAPRNDLDAVRNGSKSKKKPPTAIIPGNDLTQPTQTAATPPRAEAYSPRTILAGTCVAGCGRLDVVAKATTTTRSRDKKAPTAWRSSVPRLGGASRSANEHQKHKV